MADSHKTFGDFEFPVTCADCGSPMDLRDSRYGKFYGCSSYPKCKGTHGAHPNGKPLGKPANRATKDARIHVHAEFDKLWKGHRMSRTRAYEWMAEVMGLAAWEAHIGNFTIMECEILLEKLEQRCNRTKSTT